MPTKIAAIVRCRFRGFIRSGRQISIGGGVADLAAGGVSAHPAITAKRHRRVYRLRLLITLKKELAGGTVCRHCPRLGARCTAARKGDRPVATDEAILSSPSQTTL